MLYLTGYDLTLRTSRSFRRWGSRTPGHPEHRHTAGVEVTTGPLGQGFANAVGFGVAERVLRSRFGPELTDHHTFVIAGDGCFEEGISHEAASLAGHLRLGRLVCVYDNNHISIDGPTELAYSDVVPERFAAYGWDVDDVGEVANDTEQLEAALRRGDGGGGPPDADRAPQSHRVAGPALDRHGRRARRPRFRRRRSEPPRRSSGCRSDEAFWVPDEVIDLYRRCVPKGEAVRAGWEDRLAAWDGDRAVWDAGQAATGLTGWEAKLPTFETGEEIATRKAVNACLNATADVVPGIVAGGADLTGNTGMLIEGRPTSVRRTSGWSAAVLRHPRARDGRGDDRHGAPRRRPPDRRDVLRLQRLHARIRAARRPLEAHVVYSWTHDSVGLGQDGPTHQPVEHLAALRAMPGLQVVRPADANECAQAWKLAIESRGPVALVLSRQGIPVLAETAARAAAGVHRGGYVLAEETDGPADVVLVGTGSEVHVCLAATKLLVERRIRARVVSLPCWEWFEEQDQAYRDAVLLERRAAPVGGGGSGVRMGALCRPTRSRSTRSALRHPETSCSSTSVSRPTTSPGAPPPWWAPPRPDSCSHPSDRPGARSSFRGVPVTPDPMEDEHGGSR